MFITFYVLRCEVSFPTVVCQSFCNPNTDYALVLFARLFQCRSVLWIQVLFKSFPLNNWKSYKWFGKLIKRLGYTIYCSNHKLIGHFHICYLFSLFNRICDCVRVLFLHFSTDSFVWDIFFYSVVNCQLTQLKRWGKNPIETNWNRFLKFVFSVDSKIRSKAKIGFRQKFVNNI